MPATTEILTPERPGLVTRYPVAAATTIYAGTLVALNAEGNAVPAADAAGLRIVGRAEETVDNSTGLAGALGVEVKRGVFRYNNSGTDAVDAGDCGKLGFAQDNETISKTGGDHNVKAGRIVDVDAEGVWIDTRYGTELVPAADTLTAAADLEAFKSEIIPILTNAGILK